MVSTIDNINRHVGTGREDFDSNELVRGWVEYQLILLGEAAWRVGEEDRSYHEAHPDVPWGQLIGMRNFLIHQYHRIDRDIV